MATAAPVLSTPAEHILQEETPVVVPESRISDEQLSLQYEIKRTVDEIRAGRWKRIALQFPDEMLVDAPRVFERLRDTLKAARKERSEQQSVESTANGVKDVSLGHNVATGHEGQDAEERLCILGDTSYGACCVDEVAAEHVDAEVVVHYGRACLSPTARLPVIYVYTSKPLDLDYAVQTFKQTYPDQTTKVCIMADIPYGHHILTLAQKLKEEGYTNFFATEIVHDPSSLLPNRTLPPEVKEDPEQLKEYSLFHISTPPTSLLLILTSRVNRIHILPATTSPPAPLPEKSTQPLLRRRYALLTRLATVPVFGILINTLSVRNYMGALKHCQDLIARAGKKSYVFVVGKVNAAKVANFAEVGGWVVIGCWESSLVEGPDFWKPVITPFELEVALGGEGSRVWGGEWVGNWEGLIEKDEPKADDTAVRTAEGDKGVEEINGDSSSNWDDQPSDDEEPEFDLRTGRYVSHSRPMGKPKTQSALPNGSSLSDGSGAAAASSALIHRAKAGDLATVNGTISPAAEYLRSKRTWTGLGSDYEIAYERDENGRIQGAAMEEGRGGVAKGYAVGGGVRT
jgi:diphthamide biosynthesis protein 2